MSALINEILRLDAIASKAFSAAAAVRGDRAKMKRLADIGFSAQRQGQSKRQEYNQSIANSEGAPA